MKNKFIKDYAILFCNSKTEEKLRKDSTQGVVAAINVHYNVGKEVRTTIEKIGGTMPEDLPKPEKSIQEIYAKQTLTWFIPKKAKKPIDPRKQRKLNEAKSK